MTDRSSRDWLIFFALGFCWGSSYLFIKIGVGSIPPLTLIAGRLGIGALMLAIVVWRAGVTLPRDRRTYGHLIAMAVLNIVIPFTLITWAEQAVPSALASILNGTVPLFTIVFAALFLHDEPITVNRVVGLLVGFAGVFVLTGRTLGDASSGSIAGEVALVLSAVSYGAGNVYARRNVRSLAPVHQAFFQVAIAFAIVVALAAVVDRPWTVQPAPDAIFAVVWLGVLGSGFAYLFFFRLLSRWGSTRSSLVAYLLPVVGIVLGAVVLREAVDARVLAGTALVIGGVALVNSRFGARRLYGRAAQPPAGAETTRG
jgi:drug/metabolite transporter (DMT)-like permease